MVYNMDGKRNTFCYQITKIQTYIHVSRESIIRKIYLFLYIFIITSQNKLVSPYYGSTADLVLIGVEPGTLWCRVDVITHYTTALQLIDYMSQECSMPLETYIFIFISSDLGSNVNSDELHTHLFRKLKIIFMILLKSFHSIISHLIRGKDWFIMM